MVNPDQERCLLTIEDSIEEGREKLHIGSDFNLCKHVESGNKDFT